jgi:hypothetical protein
MNEKTDFSRLVLLVGILLSVCAFGVAFKPEEALETISNEQPGNQQPGWHPTPIAEPALSDIEALTFCQETIRSQSLNPSNAEIPYSKNSGSRGEYSFSWPTASGLLLQNAFGAMISSSASCSVNKQTGRITLLTINGKKIN